MPGLLSLGQALLSKVSGRKVSAYLQPLDDKGEPDASFPALRFQYFPETVQDTKAVNWANREIPGASLPIYQWVSSGERSISFTAWFTCDMDLLAEAATGAEEGAARFETLVSVGEGGRNVDIRSAVAWLRYFLLPTYGKPSAVGVPVAMAPRRLKLVIPGSGIGIGGGVAAYTHSGLDEITCFMSQCDFTYEAFFTSGHPRCMSAQLAFTEIAQTAEGIVRFPSADGLLGLVKGGGDPQLSPEQTFGYNLTVQPKKQ